MYQKINFTIEILAMEYLPLDLNNFIIDKGFKVRIFIRSMILSFSELHYLSSRRPTKENNFWFSKKAIGCR